MKRLPLERFEGCLLGLAVGDALGMPFEGWRPNWIRRREGGAVRDFRAAPRRGLREGMWTDDTKMALHLAESIVGSGGRVVPEDVAHGYVAWFDSGDLRGIGGATFESIMRLKSGAPWERSGKTGAYAAGNGTAMRCAPIGLINCLSLERLREDARNDAIITHSNDEAVAGSRAVCYIVALGVRAARKPSPALIDAAVEFIGDCTLAGRLRTAKTLLEQNTPTPAALEKLGTSGYVVETVASALFTFLKTPSDFETTVAEAVSAGGDTDTTAAVAGAISGAWNGAARIPRRWLDNLEAADYIRALAAKIHAAASA
ncbi:MAG: ADP-ribosylglycohydrolase family protein [bacterium]